MKNEKEVPTSWHVAWNLTGNRGFRSLSDIALSAGCDTHIPRAFKALGYIFRDHSGEYIRHAGKAVHWSGVRKWIADNRKPRKRKPAHPPTPTLRQDSAGEKQYTRDEVIVRVKELCYRRFGAETEDTFMIFGLIHSALED
jgi:hypothetical protein